MMIDFVAYFSTAQEELGYVVVNGDGTATAEFGAGPSVPDGTYRIEGGALVLIEEPMAP